MTDFNSGSLGTQLMQLSPQQLFARNNQYSNPLSSYVTPLSPESELLFQNWVKNNNIPFNPSSNSDYDMRGFYNALTTMDPRAQTAINQNDNLLHFPDTWKTPYHQSFSNESQYANQNAPSWINGSQLVAPNGQIIFDEKRGF